MAGQAGVSGRVGGRGVLRPPGLRAVRLVRHRAAHPAQGGDAAAVRTHIIITILLREP